MSGFISYRPEIDGLRAISVIAVVFYHAEMAMPFFNQFEGGFIGVDIFFVISGYLITAMILRALGKGGFSFLDFYERRARRILPALYTVMLVSIPFAWIYMLPKAFSEYAASIISSVLFGSNFYFLSLDSYFAEPSELMPFLHTWSLSVEEQFYLIYPIIIIACWKYARKYILHVLVIGFIGSLGLAEYASRYYPDASFFLFPMRGWELIMGAIIAKLELKYKRPNHQWLNQLMTLIGLVLIVGGIMTFDDKMLHPSMLTAAPVVGTALFIWFGGKGGVVSKVLSTRAFVMVGLISYSLYLWHLPVMVFQRVRSIEPVTDLELFIGIGLSVVLSLLTWKYVESPFRNKKLVPVKWVWTVSSAVGVALVIFFSVGISTNGYSFRLPDIFASGLPVESWKQLKQDGKRCHRNESVEPCVFEMNKGDKRWVLIGDSHAGAISLPLYNALEASDTKTFTTFLWGGCPFIKNVKQEELKHPLSCYDANKAKYEYLKKSPPSIVVMAHRMQLWFEKERFDNGEGGVEYGELNKVVPLKGTLQEAVIETVNDLLKMGHKVVLIYPVPEVGLNPTEVAFQHAKGGINEVNEWFDNGGLTTSYDVYKKRTSSVFNTYDSIEESENLIRVYPDKIFCSDESNRCITNLDDVFLYYDDDHLSIAGGKLVVDKVMEAVEQQWGVSAN